jgi:hypothetical protein
MRRPRDDRLDGKEWKLKSVSSAGLHIVECTRFNGGAVALVYRRRQGPSEIH